MSALSKRCVNSFHWFLFLSFVFFSSYASAAAVCTSGFISLTGSYYTANNWTGGPTNRSDTSINYDWGGGNPGIGGLGNDNFSIIWNGSIRALRTGTYTFQTASDDQVRLTVNGSVIISNLTDHALTTDTSGSVSLVAGQSYTIKLEYVEKTVNAVIKLYWKQPGETEYNIITTQSVNGGDSISTASFCSCTTGIINGMLGDYYNNNSLTAPIAQSRLDPYINFNWGGAPGPTGVASDNFSVRWNGTYRVGTAGDYYFQVTVDDGVRLYVNNTLIIDKWFANNNVTYQSSAVTLAANTDYPIKLEFYEGSVSAIMSLQTKISGGSYAYTYSCAAPPLDHYGISLSSPGVTCAGQPITISAYDSSGALVVPTAGTVVTLSTSPATGSWVGGNTYTFTGTESSFTKYLQQTTSSTLNINVTDGTYSESASLDPNIIFNDSALTFYGSTGLGTMPNQVAGTTDSNPILKASNCSSRITGAKNVSFGYECRNPTTCIAGQTFSVNSNNIQSNANGASISYSAAQSLTFDGSSNASIPINYSDVGKVKLYASMALAASGNDPAITLTANSGDFIVKPYTIAASAIQTSGAVANPGGTSTSGTASDFVAAGDAFTVKVEVRNSSGGRTPNFGNETTSENNILFSPQALIHPAGGTLTGLTGATTFTATTPAGTFMNSNVSWNQVGSFTARPELADNDYLGAGDLSVKTTSGTIGRFYPDHFALASSSTTNTCVAGGFSYLSQPTIGLNYVLQAQSSTNSVVTNYISAYGTLATVSYVAENADSADGNTYTSRLSDGATPTWSSGVMTVASTAASVLRKLTTYSPDGPFSSLQWGLNVTDTFDGGRSLSGKNMNALTTGVCAGAGCTAIKIGNPLVLRYGRLRLDSASGPETVKLPVNFLTEFWSGNGFVLNTTDSCTIVPLSAITYPSGTLATPANFTVPLSVGNTIGTYTNSSGGVHFASGNAGHYFSAPSAAGTGSFVVGIDLSTLTWLRYDWNQNGDYSDATMPNVTYKFGAYRGNDRLIYWRERF